MIKYVGVRFKPAGKVYYFDPNGLDINSDDYVIVETSRGIEFGHAVIAGKEISEEEIVSPLREVLRIATEEDVKIHNENVEKSKEAFIICSEKIKEHKLDMKLIDVEYTFDRNKVLFYFISDSRIDFRDLVKELAATFRTRIELRQVGIRDQAKIVGGLGICGRALCCASCMGDFQPVSIKMAKEQGLTLNPTKISGTCGRLMCCLKYEQDAYEAAMKVVPNVGAYVETPSGIGIVVANSLIRETVQVKLGDGEETEIMTFPAADVKIARKHKEHHAHDAADDEGSAEVSETESEETSEADSDSDNDSN
ncbi:MAG: stage 0 sporulation family protein [Clostridia bacterium]|nr:stage 0 sporulation family protein [Clostridia bacterium]